MFKNFVYNKTFKMIGLLIILAIILIFPISTKYELNNDQPNLKSNTKVYLINNDNYISETEVSLQYDSLENKIRNIIELMIIEGKYSDIIPNKFMAILPSDTKLLDFKTKDDSIILNFNSSFLKINSHYMDKYISLIVHNCLNNDKYNKLYIEVESKLLTKYNNKSYDQPFTKSNNFNVINNLSSYINVLKTNVYFYSKSKDLVPVTVLNNSEEEKVKIIIDELSNSNYKNLYSPLNYGVNLLDYKKEDETMILFFDESIFDNKYNKVILKSVYNLLETSIINNYPVKNIKVYVNNKEIKKSDIKNVE